TQVTPQEIAGFTPERFRWTQQRLFCPDNLILGVSGDFTEREMLARLERLFRGWGKCPSGLRPLPPVQFTHGPRLVLVEKDVNQSFAGAQVRAEKTVAAVRLMRNLVGSMATEPVTAQDVKLAQDNEVNSFVFQFENAGQIVAQQLGYAVDGLPPNWFDLYLKGI